MFNEEIYVVDIVLKGYKGILNDCSIFETGDMGMMALNNEGLIREALSKDVVYFQNRYVNGKVFTKSIEDIAIRTIKLGEF